LCSGLRCLAVGYVLARAAQSRVGDLTMNDRLNPNLGRRELFRVLAAGAGAAAASAPPLAAAATPSVDNNKKQRARYQADSPEVQTFYRVNRYPAK
jgi:hypothetical protein